MLIVMVDTKEVVKYPNQVARREVVVMGQKVTS